MSGKSSVALLQAQQRKAYQLFKFIVENEAIDEAKIDAARFQEIVRFGAEITAKKVGRPRKPNPQTLDAIAEINAMIQAKEQHGQESETAA